MLMEGVKSPPTFREVYYMLREQPLLVRTQLARTSAVLLAAGAFDVSPTVLRIPDAVYMQLWFSYTRGGAGGSFRWKIEGSPNDTPVWYQFSYGTRPAIVAGTDNVGATQQKEDVYQASGATIERFVVGPTPLTRGFEQLRVFGAELGAVGTPGTLEIIATFG